MGAYTDSQIICWKDRNQKSGLDKQFNQHILYSLNVRMNCNTTALFLLIYWKRSS